jgi:hypothetical protein
VDRAARSVPSPPVRSMGPLHWSLANASLSSAVGLGAAVGGSFLLSQVFGRQSEGGLFLLPAWLMTSDDCLHLNAPSIFLLPFNVRVG